MVIDFASTPVQFKPLIWISFQTATAIHFPIHYDNGGERIERRKVFLEWKCQRLLAFDSFQKQIKWSKSTIRPVRI